MHLQRRTLLKLVGASTLMVIVPACAPRRLATERVAALAQLEQQSGGRLGVAIVEPATGDISGLRLDERFGMCSTFKLPLAAMILHEAQDGRIDLDEKIAYSRDDLVPYAPVTEKYLERGYMTVRELAQAAQQKSDNVAANLLLALIGGPAGYTERLRRAGDTVTRLDRLEPQLNYVPPGDVRDTTSPAAMAATVYRFFTGSYLTDASKNILGHWMEATVTGLNRVRAGFPDHWRTGDKTGTGIAEGMPNKYNDVAVAWRQGDAAPLVVAAYYEADGEYDQMRDVDIAVLKRVGEIAANTV